MSNQNNQKLISRLQSRIADRKWEIAMHWSFYNMYEGFSGDKDHHRGIANYLGEHQKLDKQLLKVLCNNMKEHKQAFFAGCDWSNRTALWEVMNKEEK